MISLQEYILMIKKRVLNQLQKIKMMKAKITLVKSIILLKGQIGMKLLVLGIINMNDHKF